MIQPVASPVASSGFFASPEPDPSPAPVQAERPKPTSPAPDPERDVRLTIDPSPDGPFFVYTLQDRATGRIIAQLPRQQVEQMKDRAGYASGDLIDAKA